MTLLAWMRTNFDIVRGLKVEVARLMAVGDLGGNISTEELGQAFIAVDFERRGTDKEHSWKQAKREDTPSQKEVEEECRPSKQRKHTPKGIA